MCFLTITCNMLLYMYMLTKNAHILFDPQEWMLLTRIATEQNSSVNQLVRKAVQTTYLKSARNLRVAAAVDRIRKIRPHIKGINYKELINYGRKY